MNSSGLPMLTLNAPILGTPPRSSRNTSCHGPCLAISLPFFPLSFLLPLTMPTRSYPPCTASYSMYSLSRGGQIQLDSLRCSVTFHSANPPERPATSSAPVTSCPDAWFALWSLDKIIPEEVTKAFNVFCIANGTPIHSADNELLILTTILFLTPIFLTHLPYNLSCNSKSSLLFVLPLS
ncbi:hypothetical protein DFH07DRAFT_795771 [Mycena maculata]|uniref:Uncharacterized protein n=1 Tax=Mycena maculata TaxID=230809 RepID=A0AAD7NWH6_9AGAR|nr:hypothetical protein DFH07DRAFT_795771 [Mycena maculata]